MEQTLAEGRLYDLNTLAFPDSTELYESWQPKDSSKKITFQSLALPVYHWLWKYSFTIIPRCRLILGRPWDFSCLHSFALFCFNFAVIGIRLAVLLAVKFFFLLEYSFQEIAKWKIRNLILWDWHSNSAYAYTHTLFFRSAGNLWSYYFFLFI